MKDTIKISIFSVCLLFSLGRINAQNTTNQPATETTEDGVLILPPLFEYPVAPEELDWTERSNWLMTHFWDQFDFKQKSVGQSQLLHAFRTYVVPMHLADRKVALESIKDLIKKLQKNPGLMLQFTQAAERTIYEPMTSDLMIDEVYVEFLKGLTGTKKIPELRKARYKAQLQSLQNSLVGYPMYAFKYTDRFGANTKYSGAGVPVIIVFGDYDCSECRISRLRLETDDELQALVSEGKAKIMFISPDVADDDVSSWNNAVKNYPSSWTVGRGEGLEDVMDLRVVPSLFIIDAEGKIVSKTASTDQASEYVKNNAVK